VLLELNSDVLISGAKHRNRAVHGDVVVIELLPRNEWKGRTMALTEGQGEERAQEDTQSQPLPTGKHKQRSNITPLQVKVVKTYFYQVHLHTYCIKSIPEY